MIRTIWRYSLSFLLCLLLLADYSYAIDGMYQGSSGFTDSPWVSSIQAAKDELGPLKCTPSLYPSYEYEVQRTWPIESGGSDVQFVEDGDMFCINDEGKRYRYSYAIRYDKPPACPAGQSWNVDSQSCEEDAPPPADPTDCYEQGLAYDSKTQQCTEVCENGELNGVCLNPTPDNEDTCNSQSPDYQGYIGNGNNRQNICAADKQCEGGKFGLVNGIPACIPDEYGPPECGSVDVIAYDQYGWVCETPQGNPNPEPEPDPTPEPGEPNTDTDGDGEPDQYVRENDPLANAKAQDKTNQELAKANKALQTSNQNLDRIYGAVSEIADQGEQRNQDIEDSGDLVNNNTSDVGNLDDPNLVLGDEGEVNLLDEIGNYQDVPDPHVGQCPEPREIVLTLGTYQISWQPWCDFATTLYPFTLFMFSFIGVAAIARTAIR